LSTDPRTAATPIAPATAATAQPDDASLGGGAPAAAPISAPDRAVESAPSGPPTGATERDAGTDLGRPRPRPEIERILDAAVGGEDRPPSFADMVRHNATLTRELGRAEQAIGVLTVERDALKRRLEEGREAASDADEDPDRPALAGRRRWALAAALLGLLALLLIAWWVFGWSAGDLAGTGGEPVPPTPTPVG